MENVTNGEDNMFTQDHNEVIGLLANKNSRCFIEDPKLRLPLNRNVVADSDRNDFPGVDIIRAVEWYIGHYWYQKAVAMAGAQRIDLDGNVVDSVTEKEAQAAVDRINEINAQKAVREYVNPHDAPLRPGPVVRQVNGIGIAKPSAKILSDEELMSAAQRKLRRADSILNEPDEDGLRATTVRPLLKMAADDITALIARLDRA
jgi:ProQ/FINO family